MLNSGATYAIAALGVVCAVLIGLVIYLFVKISDLNKRYTYFMGAGGEGGSLEEKVLEHTKYVKNIDKKYKKIVKKIYKLEDNLNFSCQKVGVIRYNPFDDVGGKLCFCVALLNGHDSGVVINGIYSKTGTFTYAKRIENGKSDSKLSKEELLAVREAQKNSYFPVSEDIDELIRTFEEE